MEIRVKFALIMALLARSVEARVIYVMPNGLGDGSSWSSPMGTVQSAINAAVPGDQVWISAGAYRENLTLHSGVAVYGGFTSDDTDPSQRNFRTYATTIDGHQNGSVVTAGADVTQEALLSGLRLINGGPHVSGGGVHMENAALRIEDCVITGNSITAYSTGFDSLVPAVGAGISGSDGTLIVERCIITGNQASGLDRYGNPFGDGGGIYCGAVNGKVTIRDNLIARNQVNAECPGVYAIGSDVTVVNNTIVENSGSKYPAGALRLQGGTAANNVVAYNDLGTYTPYTATAANDAYGNTYRDFGGGDEGTNGNISADPHFVNRSAGNYHLLAGSPCTDTGDDSVVAPGEMDLDGNSRISGSHVDMGAYELPYAPYTLADAAAALRIAAGFQQAQPADLTHLNVITMGTSAVDIDLLDAVCLVRKVAGLDANP